MYSIYNYFFGTIVDEYVDEKVKHQRHLVLKQIKDGGIKLKCSKSLCSGKPIQKRTRYKDRINIV